MKTLRILFVVALLLGATTLRAQTTAGTDYIQLKDGSIIRGTITERITDSHVRILTAEGVAKQYTMAEIDKVHMQGIKDEITFKPLGYYNSTGLGVLIGRDRWGTATGGFSIRMVNGVEIGHHWQAGLGIGLELLNNHVQVPLFAEGRFHFVNGDVSPFVGAQAGYQLPMQPQMPYYDDMYAPEFLGGVMAGTEVGIRNVVKKHFGYSVSLGYRYMQDRSRVPYYFWSPAGDGVTTAIERISMHRFCLSFAFLFH